MVPGPSPENSASAGPSTGKRGPGPGSGGGAAPDWPRTLLDEDARARLLALANASIVHGLETGEPPAPPDDVPALLREPGACFVTLRRRGALRGCIGEIGAWRPLAESVVDRAFAAAFRDPRFPPLTERELDDLALHISVQGPLEPVYAVDERDLIRQLRPMIDGLVLRRGPATGT